MAQLHVHVVERGHVNLEVVCSSPTLVNFLCSTPNHLLLFASTLTPGVLIWRGFPMDKMMNQCYGNNEDIGYGRQMPVHYGSKEHNFAAISSPLATQMPHGKVLFYLLRYIMFKGTGHYW